MFKETFKYYKSKKTPPDLEMVIDFYSVDKFSNQVQKIDLKLDLSLNFFGFQPVASWEVFQIADRPGLLFIKNPFTALGQRYWTVRCLKDYSKKPNKSNIDTSQLVPHDEDWWEMCQNDIDKDNLILKLRWITLGYHHNWDTKIYSESNRGDFPADLKKMTKFLAKVLGYDDYSPEAAIVNYYHLDSTLSGHTDHSERNLEAPLFSFSFGQKAIFLLGGKSLEEYATPMFLRSGDIVVMAKESRLCYHGVPKILQTQINTWSLSGEEVGNTIPDACKRTVDICRDENAWKPFDDYLSNSRININVRQVLYKSENQLYDNI